MFETGFDVDGEKGTLTITWKQHNLGFYDAETCSTSVTEVGTHCVKLDVTQFVITDGTGASGSGLWENYELDRNLTHYTFVGKIIADNKGYNLRDEQIIIEQQLTTGEWVTYNHEDDVTDWTNRPVRVRVIDDTYNVTDNKFTINGVEYSFGYTEMSYNHNGVTTKLNRLKVSGAGVSTIKCGTTNEYVCNSLMLIDGTYYVVVYNESQQPIQVGKVNYENGYDKGEIRKDYGLVRADRATNWWYEYSYKISTD